MRTPIIIRDKIFKYKKDALLYFKTKLNSYDFGEILNEDDTADITALLFENETRKDKIGNGIKEIKIGKVQFGTKCFQIIRNNLTSENFSYVYCINGDPKPFTKFSHACRNAIYKDLHSVKQRYFDQNSIKGKVKCQETGTLSSWTELNVDHRQPNTLSIIIDRFIELQKIDLKNIEYKTDRDNKTILADKNLENKFRDYHMGKANLRIVRKEKNLGRSHQGRVKNQKKDLRIEKE
ncbi:MAG: DUF3223 domain-containing protein [Bacteroidota bacterium]|nr:DUF3223 domain-containing protein [Bacteroidota bacterium]